ncbi:hypothetical protein D1641_06870 [Colidextribacter sp. OB.20]|uniref:hypothetical protein n=1 Tax=Colidextribacter sp. OB.20 TaxID=2304568 RepID=UPI00136EFB94|nr:hypothetical protein [Colidextribacter sp. OB.20]NBI09738.1 hypothetical protein [Colidextribacter sp. OB.20]
MKKKRSALSVLLTAVLVLGLFRPMPASAANLYFVGLNDNVPPMTAGSMPFWSGGMLFVPYTVFDANLNGSHVNLGLYTSYNRTDNTVALFNLRQMLVFNMNDGTCRNDMTGVVYSSRAVMRNGRPYVALNTVCSFFNLEYSYSQIPYISQGYLIRIKSAAAVLDDARFIDAAQDLINTRLREYTRSLSSAATTSPGDSSVPELPEEPDGANTAVYLALRFERADGLAETLNALNSGGGSALFFLTPQLLEEEGDLVRRILGTGHSLGVLAGGGEETEEQLERGRRAVERAARTRTTLAYVPAEQREALEEKGWVCWEETLLQEPGTNTGAAAFANGVINRLGTRHRTVYLTLEGGEDAARVLPALLRQLNSSHYALSVPLETRL